jgi:DNA-binding NarL/FixJ family response regulator
MGYVPKSSDMDTLLAGVRTVLSGGVYLPRSLLTGSMALTPGAAASGPGPTLTQRQREVLELVSQGHANKEIGYRLGISEGTVKTHLAAMMRSLSVNNRVQMLREAERLGLTR